MESTGLRLSLVTLFQGQSRCPHRSSTPGMAVEPGSPTGRRTVADMIEPVILAVIDVINIIDVIN